MLVLGIDPGTASTGYGVVREHGLAPAGRRRGGDPTRVRGSRSERRLAEIHARVGELLDEHRPDALAIEELYFGANVRTRVRRRPGARGRAAGRRPARRARRAPTRPSRSRARSAATAGPTRTRSPGWSRGCSGWPSPPSPDHAADALAVAICDLNRAPLARRGARRGVGRDRPDLRHGRRAPRRPRRGRLRRRRLPAGGLGRDAQARPRGRQARCMLHTHLVVRDDALALYGFATEEERDLFLMLLGVQSVGPKVALAVLSGGAAARAARGRRRRRRGAAAGGPGRRQAHGRADHRRAAREGRRRRCPTGEITVTRGDDPRDARARGACSGSATAPPRSTSCSTAPTARRAEELIAHALRSARR